MLSWSHILCLELLELQRLSEECGNERVSKLKVHTRSAFLYNIFNFLCSCKLFYKNLICRVPARWGLQHTTQAPGSDKTRGQGSFGPVHRLTKPNN